jgi:hypothetical protein
MRVVVVGDDRPLSSTSLTIALILNKSVDTRELDLARKCIQLVALLAADHGTKLLVFLPHVCGI